jgi:hypothetical protein
MREKMSVEERQSRRGSLSNLRGRLGQAKNNLARSLVVAKRSGQIWEWRINNIIEDLRQLITNLEKEETKLRD